MQEILNFNRVFKLILIIKTVFIYLAASWKKTPFLDEKEDICDMKFGPKHLGLILAIARADGKIKIFKFSDLINLNAR